MKIVINEKGGAYVMPQKFIDECDAKGINAFYLNEDDPLFVKFVEEHEYTEDCDLIVVEIPDNTTDWKICTERDGEEYVVYVVDGKIYFT